MIKALLLAVVLYNMLLILRFSLYNRRFIRNRHLIFNTRFFLLFSLWMLMIFEISRRLFIRRRLYKAPLLEHGSEAVPRQRKGNLTQSTTPHKKWQRMAQDTQQGIYIIGGIDNAIPHLFYIALYFATMV